METQPSDREFVLAVIAGNIERVQEMHEAGIPIALQDQYGWLPIHRAAANDHADIIRLLVAWHSPLESRGTDGWTPLHLAAASCSPHAVTALLEAGAEVDVRSETGATPLLLAIGPTVTAALLATVHALVQAGASVSARDENGITPLTKARSISNPAIQKLLTAAAQDSV